jgi:hypothetical protein
MVSLQPSPLLRRILQVDAASSALMGIVMTFGAAPLATFLGLSVQLIRHSGIVLLPFAAVLLLLSVAIRPLKVAVWSIVILNALWTIDSVLLLFSGWVNPTAFGYVFVAAQAAVVGIFAAVEYSGLRRSQSVPA